MSITDFLNARIAEDEAAAREYQQYEDEVYETAGWFNCTRVLAECAAKRAIVEQWEDPSAGDSLLIDAADAGYVLAIDYTLRNLAAVYAEHPAYLDEWRVGA